MSSSFTLSSSDSDSGIFRSAQRAQHEPAEESEASSAESGERVVFNEDMEDSSQKAQQQLGTSEDESPAPPPRPNKFHGPPSTWKRWTAPERELAASLDQSTTRDLSSHLYNAFKLKQRGDRRKLSDKRLKVRQHAGNPFASTWVPPKNWTAWPLPSKVVPRDDLNKYSSPDITPPFPYLPKPVRPGEQLRGILVAQALRQAKINLKLRELDPLSIPSTKSGNNEEDDASTETSIIEGSTSIGEASPTSETFVTSGRLKQSRASFPGASHARYEPGKDLAVGDLRPTVMADDEIAMSILQPTIMRVMADLDSLLISLHRTRNSYLAVQAPDDDADAATEKQVRSKSCSRKRWRSLSTRRRARSLSIDLPLASDDEAPHDEALKKRRISAFHSDRFQNRKSKLGLRDWGDVFGIASMVGFDELAVERATSRCADLFDEGMAFRTLKRGNDVVGAKTFRPDQATSQMQCGPGHSSQDRRRTGGVFLANAEMLDGVHLDGFLQPIKAKRSWRSSHMKGKP
ncbi:MAG: hypothetical protein Q9164_001006 [Protoblastenia rupestris]